MTTPRLKNVTPHSDAGQQLDHDDVYYPIDDEEPWQSQSTNSSR